MLVRSADIMRKNLISFSKDRLGVTVRESDIAAIHHLPGRRGHDARGPKPVLVRFSTNDKKTEVMKARRRLREQRDDDRRKTPIYINDQLTQWNAQLFKACRDQFKQNRLLGTWTINGVIRVKTLASQIRIVKNLAGLAELV